MKSPYVLCINPWIFDFAAYDHWSRPLGLLYVAAYLKQRGLEIGLIDCLDKHHPQLLKIQNRAKPKLTKYGIGPFHREIVETPAGINWMPRQYARYGWPENIFISELKSRPKPSAILLTTIMTYWYLGPQRIIEFCRKIYPGVPIIMGGIYATLMPEHAKSLLKPDYLITGPGEIETANILADVLKMPHLREGHPTNLDHFPYPAFELYRQVDYYITMTSRGCPFRCSFCSTYKINEAFTQRNPEAVVEEILSQTRRFKTRDVAYYDDALFMQGNIHIKPILREIINRKSDLRFHTPNGLHARYIDEELAELMFRCSFKTIRLSLESVAKERLHDIHNKITPGQMTRAVKNLVAAGYQSRDLETYIIMGLPNQPVEEVLESILYANNLGIRVRLASFSPIPGTKDYQRAITNGFLPQNPDPLITNKTVIPLARSREAYQQYYQIARFTEMLNEGLKKGISLIQPLSFRENLFKAFDKIREWE